MAIRFVVGLGNPGRRYEFSRHNVGFRVVDEIARSRKVVLWSAIGSAAIASVEMCDTTVRLVLPGTYMNRSGAAVLDLRERWGDDPAEILVVVDDIDLELGRMRLRRSGGAGTHNGLRSICDAIGDGYPRLRIGVRGSESWPDLADFVLAEFTDDEVEAVLSVAQRSRDAVRAAVCGGLNRAMNQFNRAP